MNSSPLFLAPLLRYAAKLRHPQLFLAALAVFVLDVLIPDAIPFADELILGLLTLLLGSLKKRPGGTAD